MTDQANLPTPLSPVRQHWMPSEQAIEQYLAYEERYGRGHALLACHAAFPLIVTPELVNLIRINFLADQAIDWVAEADFLLAFCHPIDTNQGLYQIDPGLRQVMLADLQESHYGIKRLYELADFLLACGEQYVEHLRRPDISHIHQWIAWSYLYPQKLVDELRSALLVGSTHNIHGTRFSAYQIHVATMIEVMRDTFENWSSFSEKQYQELLQTAQVVAHYWYRSRTPVSTSTQNQQLARAVYRIDQIISDNEEKELSGKRPLNIQITGGTLAPESALIIARRLGSEIIRRGHRLLTYGSDGVDLNVTLGAQDACISTGRDPKEYIKIFRPRLNPSPSINIGYFEITGKNFEECRHRVIRQSDILILLSGEDGTLAVARQAQVQQKPIIPVGATGGTAEYLWQQLMSNIYGHTTSNFQINENSLKSIGPSQVDEQELVKSILYILDINVQISSDLRGSFETSSKEESETFQDIDIVGASNFDERALLELYDRYEARIYSYIYRRTGNESLAEDLTAQVFLKMREAIRSEKAWHSSFSGWLYRIAHNAVIDYYRQRDRQPHVALEETLTTVATEHNPVVMAEVSLDADRLRFAIGRLTEEQAEVITLRFLEGYSISEVAIILDKTEGSTKALQYRAVSNLRMLLERGELMNGPMSQSDWQQLTSIVAGISEINEGDVTQRSTFFSQAGLEKLRDSLDMSGAAHTFAGALVDALERHGFLEERLTHHALGVLCEYMIEHIPEQPQRDKQFLAGLIIKYGLIKDAVYIQQLRDRFKITMQPQPDQNEALALPSTQRVASPAHKSSGIPAVLLADIRQALLDCDEIHDSVQLRSILRTSALRPFSNSLKVANNPSTQVDYLIGDFTSRYLATGENALALLLEILGNRYDPVDARHGQLLALVAQVRVTTTPAA